MDDGYEYLGNGPAATGDGPGWAMRADIYARCARCGDLMSLAPDEAAQCRCGAPHKDPDAGRFGSSLGDNPIEIYQYRTGTAPKMIRTTANLNDVTKRFQQAMQLMRRHDPQAKEDGFHLLLPHVAEHIDELIAEFAQERDDHGLRCWLLELIGQARSPRALSVLTEQLHSDDESLRYWAAKGLEQLDSKPARQELWKARANGLID